LELHRLIFRLDYPKAYSIFAAWGQILQKLDSSAIWTQLGEDISRSIVAFGEDDSKNRVHVLNVRVNDIDGAFEGHPIKSYREFDDEFRRVNEILQMLNIQEYTRLGVRFYFLEPQEEFEPARKLVADQLRNEYLDVFRDELSDIGIATVHGEGDEKWRFSVGPLGRAEYKNWFAAPDGVKFDCALIFDIDCYTQSYKDSKLDMRKLVALYYDNALSQAERVWDCLKPKD
jgi:hypothetical protein